MFIKFYAKNSSVEIVGGFLATLIHSSSHYYILNLNCRYITNCIVEISILNLYGVLEQYPIFLGRFRTPVVLA